MTNKLKQLNVVLIVGLMFTVNIYGQTWADVSIGSQNLFDVDFITANSGFLVGTNGKIYKTSDGAASWDSVDVSAITTSNLIGVQFTDSNNGKIAGYSGAILKTTDSGANWTNICPSGYGSVYFSSVYFTDSNKGIVVGGDSNILKTVDGGSNWTFPTSPIENKWLSRVRFFDANNGAIVGESGSIFHTTDGGATWVNQTDPTLTEYLYDVCFTSTSTGYIVGTNGTLLKTIDGGSNWSYSQLNGLTIALNGIHFSDALNGTIVGQLGFIFHTTDGGANWVQQKNGTNNLNGVYFTDSNVGYVVGDDGTVLKTTDASLPVTLTDFSVKLINGAVQLDWSTSAEIENMGFNIYRKELGGNYSRLSSFSVNSLLNGFGTTSEFHSYSYIDNQVETGKSYRYLLADISYNGVEKKHCDMEKQITISENEEIYARLFQLGSAYPNPFNPATTLPLTLENEAFVSIDLYNAMGQKVKSICKSHYSAGDYQFKIDGSDLSSGVFFIQIKVDKQLSLQKIILIK